MTESDQQRPYLRRTTRETRVITLLPNDIAGLAHRREGTHLERRYPPGKHVAQSDLRWCCHPHNDTHLYGLPNAIVIVVPERFTEQSVTRL